MNDKIAQPAQPARAPDRAATFEAVLLGTISVNGSGSSATKIAGMGMESLNKTPLRLDNVCHSRKLFMFFFLELFACMHVVILREHVVYLLILKVLVSLSMQHGVRIVSSSDSHVLLACPVEDIQQCLISSSTKNVI